MVTVQEVFDMAIHLMDEQNESNGQTMTSDTQEYKVRTISLLNMIMPGLYPYSDNYKPSGTGRPTVPPLLNVEFHNPDFTQAIPIDDTLARGVLPYALASHLIAGENAEMSAWFLQRYNNMLYDLRDKIPARFEPVYLPYGLF